MVDLPITNSTFQSIAALIISSLLIVIVWYVDSELKSLQGNIKIIQNMLKVIIANQSHESVIYKSQLPNEEDCTNTYIPYESNESVPMNKIDPISETIPEASDNDKMEKHEVVVQFKESIQTEVCIPDVAEVPEVVETPVVSEVPEVTETPVISEVPEVVETPVVSEVPEVLEVPEEEPVKKKRVYRKKNEISV